MVYKLRREGRGNHIKSDGEREVGKEKWTEREKMCKLQVHTSEHTHELNWQQIYLRERERENESKHI